MSKSGKRMLLSKGKGYLSAAGPQARFIVFLLLILAAYTFLLKIFQKLSAIVALPVFLPISLITLLLFIGIVGTLYSHRFTGPMIRIRRAIDQLADGEASVSLRLRDSDDPMLRDLAAAVGRLCEHTRNSHRRLQEAAQALQQDLSAVRAKIDQGASAAELRPHLEGLKNRQEAFDKAMALQDPREEHGHGGKRI